MPGGQRIENIVVKPWNKRVRVDTCRLERGPCHRAGVDREFGNDEYYLEHWDGDTTLTIYVLPKGIQHIIHYGILIGQDNARRAIRENVTRALGLH